MACHMTTNVNRISRWRAVSRIDFARVYYCEEDSTVISGVNCSVLGCGLCRQLKGIGIFKLPVAKDEAHRKRRNDKAQKRKMLAHPKPLT